MDVLWSPWRYDYITGSGGKPTGGCVFCDILNDPASDEEKFILKRAGFNFVILNVYPYTSGHLMIVPYEHAATLDARRQRYDGRNDGPHKERAIRDLRGLSPGRN